MKSPSPSISLFSPISSFHNFDNIYHYQSHCPSISAFNPKPCETTSTFSPTKALFEPISYLELSPTTSTTSNITSFKPSVNPPSLEDNIYSLSRRPSQLPHTCFKHLLSFQPQSWTSLTSFSPALLPPLLGRIRHHPSPDPPPFHPRDLSTRSFPLHPPPLPPRFRQPLLRQFRLVPKNYSLQALPQSQLPPQLPSQLPLDPRVSGLRRSHRILWLLQPRSSQNGLNRKMSWSSIWEALAWSGKTFLEICQAVAPLAVDYIIRTT